MKGNIMATMITRRSNRNRNGLPSIFSIDPLGTLRDEFDQMLTNWFSTSDNPGALPTYSPLLDVSESDANYEVKVDLPGIKAEEVKVQVSDNVLTISGERKSEKFEGKKNGGTPHCIERYHGMFSRSVVLPAAVKQDSIDAQYHDGVLTVTLPKAEETKPCQITVKT
jgi:HSP20 family protein